MILLPHLKRGPRFEAVLRLGTLSFPLLSRATILTNARDKFALLMDSC